MSEPIPFHSTYLAPLSRYRVVGRAGRILWRGFLLLLSAGLLGLLIAAVAWRWLPRSGIGWLLYWLHDNLFLPLKGYSFTLFIPNSLVWWSIIGIALGLSLLSLLSDRSFLRSPHVWLLRRTVRMSGSGRWLLGSANLLRRAGVRPDLLTAVVHHELELALLSAAEQPGAQTATHLCNRIRHLAVSEIRLYALPPAPPITAAHLAAGVIWHAAFLPLDLRRRGDIRRPQLDEASEQNAAFALAAQLPNLLGLPAHSPEDDRISNENPFSPQRLMLDLWRLAVLAAPGLFNAIPEHARRPGLSSGDSANQLALLLSCYDRTRLLQSWAREMQPMARGLAAGFMLPDARRGPELDTIEHTLLPYIGQLTLSLALHGSWLGNAPELALATLDAIEVSALRAELEQDNSAPTEAINALLKGLPTPYAYSLTAQLVEIDARARWGQWRPFADFPDSPIQQIDHERALDQADALYQASGPGFWSSDVERVAKR